MYTKIPLYLFVIKKEIKVSGDITVYNIHFSVLLAYKINTDFEFASKILRKY
jgi:hypothetical protein